MTIIAVITVISSRYYHRKCHCYDRCSCQNYHSCLHFGDIGTLHVWCMLISNVYKSMRIATKFSEVPACVRCFCPRHWHRSWACFETIGVATGSPCPRASWQNLVEWAWEPFVVRNMAWKLQNHKEMSKELELLQQVALLHCCTHTFCICFCTSITADGKPHPLYLVLCQAPAWRAALRVGSCHRTDTASCYCWSLTHESNLWSQMLA